MGDYRDAVRELVVLAEAEVGRAYLAQCVGRRQAAWNRSCPTSTVVSPGSSGCSQMRHFMAAVSDTRASGFRALAQSTCSTPPAFGNKTFCEDVIGAPHLRQGG